VVGKVDDGLAIGGGAEVHAEGVVLGEGVDGGDREVAGEALLAVLAEVGELEGGAELAGHRTGRPGDLVEALAAVQAVLAVVDRQAELLPVEGEAALGDAVAVAPDEAAEVGALRRVVVQVVEPEHHVVEVAARVRHVQRHHGAAVTRDAGHHAGAVAERVNLSEGALADEANSRLLLAVAHAARIVHGRSRRQLG